MKTKVNARFKLGYLLLLLGILLNLPYQQSSAQNRKPGGGAKAGGGARAGGGGNAARPKQPANKPGGGGGNAARPKQPANKPGGGNNAGNNRPGKGNNAGNKPGGGNNAGNNRPGGNNAGDRKNNVSNSGNRTNNIGSNNKKVNIDNSKRNVNVNVDKSKNIRVNNSRHTAVRRAPNYRPYARPPYRYGGYRYNCYRPYYYHPYRPFVWGPMWHPWGFFVATLATTAIILSVDNNVPHNVDFAYNPVLENSYYPFEQQQMRSGPSFPYYTDYEEYYSTQTGSIDLTIADQYYYDAGVYYLKEDDGYTVVAAPIGAKIKSLPSGYETVSIDDKTKNYYYGGTFYEKTSAGYTVVPPTAGAVVANVSEGGEDVKMGDVTYVKLGDTYFQPIQQDGKNMYEVADVEEDK